MNFKVAAFSILLTAIGAGIFGLSDLGGNIHPPVRSPSKVIPYEPERIIRTTLREYLKRGTGRKHETTGRYVTFGLPMKYLDPWEIYDRETPRNFRMYVEWEKLGEGASGRIKSIDRSSLNVGEPFVSNGKYSVSLSSFKRPSLPKLLKETLSAKTSGRRFDGYKPGATPGDVFWLGEEYCGFELFERDDYRNWHIAAGTADGVDTPPEILAPFDHARMFALPNEQEGYKLIVECHDRGYSESGICRSDVSINEYIVGSFIFEGGLLCEIDDVIESHVELLRQSTVDEAN